MGFSNLQVLKVDKNRKEQAGLLRCDDISDGFAGLTASMTCRKTSFNGIVSLHAFEPLCIQLRDFAQQ
jgi:hypothetical protein